jgi:hypothetical protein
MHPLRRLASFTTAALLALALGAPVASADALRQGGAPVATPFTLTATSVNTVFTGVFAMPINCATSTITIDVTTNNVFGTPARGDVTVMTWGACVAGGVACTVTAAPLPWAGAAAIGFAPKRVAIGVPANGTITVNCGGTACTYVGALAVPPQGVRAGWVDSPGAAAPATYQFVNAGLTRIAPSAATCGAGPLWNALYTSALTGLSVSA